MIAEGTYDIHKPNTVQTFATTATAEASTDSSGGVYQGITLEVLDNHGHADYTCMYRMRVHGDKQ